MVSLSLKLLFNLCPFLIVSVDFIGSFNSLSAYSMVKTRPHAQLETIYVYVYDEPAVGRSGVLSDRFSAWHLLCSFRYLLTSYLWVVYFKLSVFTNMC